MEKRVQIHCRRIGLEEDVRLLVLGSRGARRMLRNASSTAIEAMPLFDHHSKSLELARRVREVFPDPGWPIDRRVSEDPKGDLDIDYVDEHFRGKRWQEITDDELGWTAQDSWAFSNEGLAYFLPAYIVCCLEERYPGAANFGEMYLECWLLNQFIPLRLHGFSREQAELILTVWQHISHLWGEDDEYSQHNYVKQLLELELAEWSSL